MLLRKGSRECVAIAFSIALLAACGQKDGASTTATGTATTTAATTATSTSTSTATESETAKQNAPGTTTTTGTDTAVAPSLTTASTAATKPSEALNAASVGTTLPGSSPVTGVTAAPGATAATPSSSITGDQALLAAKTAASTTAAPKVQDVAPGQKRLTLNEFPDNLAICNVAGNEIKVHDYKRMLALQQMQMNQTLAGDANARAQLAELAKKNNISLTDEEKKQLIEASKRQHGSTEKEFQDWLKSINGTEAQFKEEIWRTGLAFKTSNMILEQKLLPDLVNRELMAQAAYELGGERMAVNQYFRFKASKHYNVLKELTHMSPEDIRDEIVKAELAKQQLIRIQNKVKVTDDEVKKVYEANKEKLKHGDQVRLAKILILCPPNDVGDTKSIRTQLANSTKLTGEDLDKKVIEFTQQKKNEAALLLARASAGEDFAKMANDLSQDPENEKKKNGGDLGWLETKTLVPELAKAVEPLKKGQCIPSVVANPMGFLIFKVVDRRPAGYSPLADIKPQLEERIKQEKINGAVQDWLNKRRNIVRVEYTPNFLAIAQGRSPVSTPSSRIP